MDAGGSGGDIGSLPEVCLSHIISLTSPRDACRLEAVSAAFRSVAASDNVWRSFLLSDYAEMLAQTDHPVEFASLKHLYFRLCDPIIIDDREMCFFVDRETGAKCFILPARLLEISLGDHFGFWRWKTLTESIDGRYEKVILKVLVGGTEEECVFRGGRFLQSPLGFEHSSSVPPKSNIVTSLWKYRS